MMMNSNGKGQYSGNGHANAYGSDMQERQVSIKDYIRVLYKARWVIIISFLLVVISTAYYTFTTEPVYEATAKLMIEEEGGMAQSMFDLTSMMKKETMINNQVEILKSRTLAENVIRDLMASEYADELRYLGNSPEGKEKKAGIIASTRSWLAGLIKNKDDQGLEVSEEDDFDRYVAGLRASINVSPIRNTDMINIIVSAYSPFEAAYVTDAVANAYRRMNQAQSKDEVRQVKNFLEDQLDQYRRELSTSEEALKNYKQEAKLVALDQETEELVRKLAEFESLYNGAKTDYQANLKRLEYINGQLQQKQGNFDMESISSQPYLQELKKQIAEKESQLASYMASMAEIGAYDQIKNEIQLRERQIDAVKEKFKQEVTKIAASGFVDPSIVSTSLFSSKIEVETELKSLEPKVKALGEIVAQYSKDLESLPAKSLQLARLVRKAQVDEKIYIMLQEKFQESRITEVGQLGNVRMIDPAKEPKFPVKPKKKLNLILGILVGLGLGIGIAFVMEYMDNSLRTMEDIEILGQSIIATIPFIKPEGSNGALSKFKQLEDAEAQDISERLVTHLRPKSPISESYRTLRTNIMFSNPDKEIKSIVITSSGPKEGKSTSISNLAITFSQMGTNTLLIDGDLRRPILHKLFNLDKKNGLTNVLVGRANLDEVVQRNPDLPNLDLLSCGILPPNPAELLGSQQMRRLLTEAKEKYGIILIDTPPTIAVTDSSVLAPLVDGVLLVVKSGGTQRDAFLRAQEQLHRVGAHILGVILNSIQASNVYGSYYYYYYYHYYYGQDGEKKRSKSRRRKAHKKTHPSDQTIREGDA